MTRSIFMFEGLYLNLKLNWYHSIWSFILEKGLSYIFVFCKNFRYNLNNFWPTQSSISSEDAEYAGFHLQNSEYFESLNHQVRSIKEWGKSRDPSKRLGSSDLFWIRNCWTVNYSSISFVANTVLNEMQI